MELESRIDLGDELAKRQVSTENDMQTARQEHYTWDEFNTTLIRRSFTTSKPADDYASHPGIFFVGGGPEPLHVQLEDFRRDVATKVRRLRSLKDQLSLYDRAAAPTPPPSRPVKRGEGVFIVHGRNEAAKQEVARFIRAVTGRDPTILHEQPHQGRTIIEKFEEAAGEIGFAVVLLTADDEGGLRGSGELHPRARQNVVFELGFFIGQLGRSRVAVLYEEKVETPTDISGVLWTSLAGEWKLGLARELQAAGITVDLNKAL
jgi:predicted nucleotide-binding protein